MLGQKDMIGQEDYDKIQEGFYWTAEGYDKIGRIPRQGQKTKIGNYNRTRVEQEKKIKSKSKRKFK